jgi:hypothetical protein
MIWNIIAMVLSGWFLLGFIAHGLIIGYTYKFREEVILESGGFILFQMFICMVGGGFALAEGFQENPWFKYGWRVW